ncbi:hypothetical protein LCGC14_3117080 [marine sediment metagenome]|uniref:Uncharacterized protein n=1 Tax=marine sediment metagenome TaxID=412755 RepID=A0A0F8WSB0_9ZZZZ
MTIIIKKVQTTNGHRIHFVCDHCDNESSRQAGEYHKSKNHFCSQYCAKIYRDINLARPQPGDKKHRLTLIERFSHPNYKTTYYKCRCDCGEITEVGRNKWGVTKTCNMRINHKGEESGSYCGYGQISLTHWNQIKRGTIRKSRTLEFFIDIKYAWHLYLEQNQCCALSGTKINLSKNRDKEITASLDRIDSKKGYVKGNVQWVHKDLNIMKMNMTTQEFINWCKKVTIYENN